MAWFSILTVTLTILSLSPNPTSSISLQSPNPNSPPKTGDQDAVNNPTPSSFSIILPKTSFIFNSSTSLSSHLTFQIGNSVTLVFIPSNFPSKFVTNKSLELLSANRLLGIEFYANVCKVSSPRINNVFKNSNVLRNGVNISSWIDYYAISKRLDVRVSKLGDPKPVEPLVSYGIDLGEVLRGGEVLLGLVSFNGVVYSWSLEVDQDVPKWMHSIPVNPGEGLSVGSDKKEGGFVLGYVFATGCGALAVLVMFFVWLYVVDRLKVDGGDSACAGGFKYEKIDVLEVKNSEAAMK